VLFGGVAAQGHTLDGLNKTQNFREKKTVLGRACGTPGNAKNNKDSTPDQPQDTAADKRGFRKKNEERRKQRPTVREVITGWHGDSVSWGEQKGFRG